MLLRHIRYLQAVAEHQNFTRAAEALHVSQPTLSQQIRQLEDLLQVQLLDRSGRTVRLTDAGEAYLRHARRALQDLDAGRRAIHDVQDLSRGTLRLAVTPTFTAYLIGPLLARFNELYPGITVSLEETTQDRIEAALAGDLLDIGIAFDEVRSPDIESEVLFVETLSLVVGAAHRCAAQKVPLAVREHGAGVTGAVERRVCDAPLHRSVLPAAAHRAAGGDRGEFAQCGGGDRAARTARHGVARCDRA